jgi:hypothetical protein
MVQLCFGLEEVSVVDAHELVRLDDEGLGEVPQFFFGEGHWDGDSLVEDQQYGAGNSVGLLQDEVGGKQLVVARNAGESGGESLEVLGDSH